jgi:hypothetical protein
MTSPDRTRSIGRRRLLALLGAGVPAVLAGCTGRPAGETDYGERHTVGDLPTPAGGNASEATEAAAARARAELADDAYAVGLAALTLRSHELVVKDDYRGVVLEGIVENTGQTQIEYVEVRTRLYDADGNQLGRYLDSTADLAAGGTWSYDVVVLEDPADVHAYDVAVLGARG